MAGRGGELRSARGARLTAVAQQPEATSCPGCRKPAGAGSVVWEGAAWHPACVACHHCHAPLAGRSLAYRRGALYCPPCAVLLFARHCSACGTTIPPGQSYLSLAGRTLHPACFTCAACGAGLAERGFTTESGSGRAVCPDCAVATTDKFDIKN